MAGFVSSRKGALRDGINTEARERKVSHARNRPLCHATLLRYHDPIFHSPQVPGGTKRSCPRKRSEPSFMSSRNTSHTMFQDSRSAQAN